MKSKITTQAGLDRLIILLLAKSWRCLRNFPFAQSPECGNRNSSIPGKALLNAN
jgi:hypothetical protein